MEHVPVYIVPNIDFRIALTKQKSVTVGQGRTTAATVSIVLAEADTVKTHTDFSASKGEINTNENI